MSGFLIPALLIVSSANAAEITPVQKVVQMMVEMKDQGVQEMKAEEVTFSSFASWCQTTARQRTKAVKKGEAAMTRLTANIEKLGSDAKELSKKLLELDKLIAIATVNKEAANARRTGEHQNYTKDDKETTESIEFLHEGANKVKAMMAGSAAASFVQELAKKPRVPLSARRALASFLQSAEADVNAPEASTFESQSGGIEDMMVGLEDKFGEKQQDNWREEKAAEQSFAMLEQTLTDEIEGYNRVRASKASTKHQKEQDAGASKGELAEAKTAHADDSKYLADLKTTCAGKTADFEARQKLRTGEIDAIDQAIEILSSDTVAGSASKHLPALTQVGAQHPKKAMLAQLRSVEQLPVQSAAAAFLKIQGKRLSSAALLALSTKVSQDPFKKVIKMIKDMVIKLTQEATDESEHKGFCDSELATNKASRDSLTSEVDELTAALEEMNAKSVKLTQDITALSQELTDLDASVSKATEIRSSEKAKNVATIADSKAAIGAVDRALVVLKEFYAKAAGSTALAQASKGVVDDMPQTFDKPYTGMENGGVMGMLDVILSDFQRLEASTTQAEVSAEDEFSVFSGDSAVDKAEKSKQVEMKTHSRQETQSDAATVKSDLQSSQTQLNAAMDYYMKLKPSCVDAGLNYEERVSQRKEEIESLQEALKILTP